MLGVNKLYDSDSREVLEFAIELVRVMAEQNRK